MKKVLITGAFGYLGARICHYLDNRGYFVTAFDKNPPVTPDNSFSSNAEIIIGDITDYTTVAALAERKYDVLIHLISLDHKASDQEPNYISAINVMPAWNLLELFQHSGLETFIYFSTFHVYGDVGTNKIIENSQLRPRNKYALTHMLTENIVNYYHHNSSINCINLRLTNSYGSPVYNENNCWWLVINDLCHSAFYRKKISLLSDGTPQRDFIHSSDICRAVDFFVKENLEGLQYNTFNLSSGETRTILELAEAIRDVYFEKYGRSIPIELPTESRNAGKSTSPKLHKYKVDNSRLKSLGIIPNTSIKDGVLNLFRYFEDIQEGAQKV